MALTSPPSSESPYTLSGGASTSRIYDIALSASPTWPGLA